MSRSNPGTPSSWVPSRVEGEPIWYSDDGSFVLMRRDSWERLHIRLLVPPTLDVPRRLDDAGYAPTPGAAESTDEVPTVVQQQGWGAADGPEVSDAVFSGGQQHGRPVVTQRIVSTSTDADLPDAQHRRLNIGLLTITGVLLALAAGVTIGAEISAWISESPAPIAAPQLTAPAPAASAPAAPAAAAPAAAPSATPAPAPAPPAPAPVVAPAPAVAPAALAPVAAPAPPAAAAKAPPPPPAPRPEAPAPQPAPAGVWGSATGNPPPPPPPKPTATVDQGWELVERDARAAADVFRSVLAGRPADPEAHYGLGYALLKLGDRGGATTHLCRARSGPASTQREVAGLLTSNNLSCD